MEDFQCFGKRAAQCKCERCGSEKSTGWRWVKLYEKACQIRCLECCADKANVLNSEGVVVWSNDTPDKKEAV